jgi:hypothetical protein
MAARLNRLIFSTVIAASAAVGFATSGMLNGPPAPIAKADRLEVVVAAAEYRIVETRGHGVSVLARVATR